MTNENRAATEASREPDAAAAETRRTSGLREGAVPTASHAAGHDPAIASANPVSEFARQLLRRWGVVFRDLLARESLAPAWRDLLVVLRRMEARGQIRGGRFVEGYVGEQFALPEAVELLRAARKNQSAGTRMDISAADPLNLVGIIVPGERVSPAASRGIIFGEGVPLPSMPFVVPAAVTR